ncbi:MAG: hypothetical protein DKM50_03545 [Candidatus Margulisiibacteriota bacterium]|nr:MAG: hypothetical protein A2X43_12665 [Candidatus Margulisbacteria bacterium GWD2_39_127]OGI02843.1 MAG: hypothetical protein A2X42_02085 [Candidatus Margulisbacteria bacterium GWF2_38_17]OGI09624.1 MAG: hypothetical protein A2X41_04795 [Candidatus Margulisbacteria bacterium GWE2_39_32]PZM83052.1 MAG: hypothetical protein DKM50_03545 [Candidatus Margulisiibacteriota bacterium]HAR63670.1 hypothetical protein [Candidatus Margulisiibacteriota bacterium]
MDYPEFIEEIKKLDFINDQITADAAIKLTLKILVDMIPEQQARLLTEKLPEQFHFDRLGKLPNDIIKPISINEYILDISKQLRLNIKQSRLLINLVLRTIKTAIKEEAHKTENAGDLDNFFKVA